MNCDQAVGRFKKGEWRIKAYTIQVKDIKERSNLSSWKQQNRALANL